MNRYIPDEIIDQIRNRCEIVDLIGSYIPVKKAGRNFKALCPFHNEKTPSFTVNPERNSFHCFGCGKGGDIFRFVMEKEGVDFPNAVHLIAAKYNIYIPEEPIGGRSHNPQAASRRNSERERLYKLYELTCTFYQQQLKNPQNPVHQYLVNRGIPFDVAEEFRLGAAPESWSDTIDYCRKNGFTDKELITADLAKQSEKKQSHIYDTFRNRLMFPIWNEQGKVVAFSGRTLEADAKAFKYVNSGETPLFTKSRILYALSLARKSINELGYAILCEGQLDVIAMHRAGFKNAIAPQGTAFTDEQARIIKRYTDRLFLAFDSDAAGIKAIMRAFDIAVPIGLEVRVICFPDKSDPDEIYKQYGAAGIQQIINQSRDFLDFILAQNMQTLDQDSSWDVNRFIAEVLDHVSKIESSITRASYCSKIAQRFSLPEEAVFNELKKRRKQDSFKPKKMTMQHGGRPQQNNWKKKKNYNKQGHQQQNYNKSQNYKQQGHAQTQGQIQQQGYNQPQNHQGQRQVQNQQQPYKPAQNFQQQASQQPYNQQQNYQAQDSSQYDDAPPADYFPPEESPQDMEMDMDTSMGMDTNMEMPASTPMVNSNIIKAEETLLELALTHGTVGHRLANELPTELITKDQLGKALEDVIKLTLDGEWENSTTHLQQKLNMEANPDPTISRILNTTSTLDHERQEKAVSDCIAAIKEVHIQQEVMQLKQQLATAATPEQKKAICQKLSQKNAERRALYRRETPAAQ